MTASFFKHFKKALTVLLTLVLFSGFVMGTNVYSQSPGERLKQLNEEINEYTREIDKLRSQANTLSNQIAQYDAQIRLAGLRIAEIEELVKILGNRISLLEMSLNSLTDAFSVRAQKTYKMSRLGEPLTMIISAKDISEAVSSFHYLKRIQEADRSLLLRLEEAQVNYIKEKTEKEDLQDQLEKQRRSLDNQKTAKANLLEITKNDETRYQSLLAGARAELEAIQAIIAGKGEETEVGEIGEGQRIASVIVGRSACSTGTHLHFEIVKGGAHINPAGYLTHKEVIWDNAPDGPFSFNGSWQWPLNDPVRITQGYGMTYYASNLRYYGGSPHTGIDMVSTDLTVKSVKPGTLYLGSIPCGGGILRYVRVKQPEGYDTYYLHVNY